MSESTVIPYTGSAPGADSNTYVLFSTVSAFPGKRMAQSGGGKRFVASVRHAAAGTLNLYKSTDRGTNWVLISTLACASTTVDDTLDALIEHLDDFKMEWVNGGSPQATFVVSMAISTNRAASV